METNSDIYIMELKSPVSQETIEFQMRKIPLLIEYLRLERFVAWVSKEFCEFSDLYPKYFGYGHVLFTDDPETLKFFHREFNLISENSRMKKNRFHATRAHKNLLKFLHQFVYWRAIPNAKLLNKYQPFTANVYGEIQFSGMQYLIDKYSPSCGVQFLDLGCGVGQAVMQVAGFLECNSCVGIEINETPFEFSRALEKEFKSSMRFFGKSYSDFQIFKGNFLHREFRPYILSSNFILVNNYAFDSKLNMELENIFKTLKDGTMILSTKSFIKKNFRLCDYTIDDFGAVATLENIETGINDMVSWTPYPVTIYKHIIDNSMRQKFLETKIIERENKNNLTQNSENLEPSFLKKRHKSSLGIGRFRNKIHRASSKIEIKSLSLTQSPISDSHIKKRRGRKPKIISKEHFDDIPIKILNENDFNNADVIKSINNNFESEKLKIFPPDDSINYLLPSLQKIQKSPELKNPGIIISHTPICKSPIFEITDPISVSKLYYKSPNKINSQNNINNDYSIIDSIPRNKSPNNDNLIYESSINMKKVPNGFNTALRPYETRTLPIENSPESKLVNFVNSLSPIPNTENNIGNLNFNVCQLVTSINEKSTSQNPTNADNLNNNPSISQDNNFSGNLILNPNFNESVNNKNDQIANIRKLFDNIIQNIDIIYGREVRLNAEIAKNTGVSYSEIHENTLQMYIMIREQFEFFEKKLLANVKVGSFCKI